MSIARKSHRGRIAQPGNGDEPRVSRLQRPEELSVEAWQRRLRQQFGSEQPFLIENVGDHDLCDMRFPMIFRMRLAWSGYGQGMVRGMILV